MGLLLAAAAETEIPDREDEEPVDDFLWGGKELDEFFCWCCNRYVRRLLS